MIDFQKLPTYILCIKCRFTVILFIKLIPLCILVFKKQHPLYILVSKKQFFKYLLHVQKSEKNCVFFI